MDAGSGGKIEGNENWNNIAAIGKNGRGRKLIQNVC